MNGALASLIGRMERVDIRVWTIIASLLLSVYASLAVTVPNDDSFLYVRTAQIFLQDGIQAAFAHYPWAGYSVLLGIAGGAGLELFAAAYLLNGLFFALLAFAFVGICREFSDDRRLLLLAALSVLLFPEINEYRFQILRDSGFWAFSLLGMWQLIRYSAAGAWKHSLSFCAALLIAAVFRPEAILYLLLAPLCLLFDRRYTTGERYRMCFRIQAVAIGALLLCFTAGLAFDLNLLGQAAAMAATYLPFWQSIFDTSGQQMAAMAEALFGEHAAIYSGRYLPLVLVAGLLVILVVELFYAVGMPFVLMLAWGWWRKLSLPGMHGATHASPLPGSAAPLPRSAAPQPGSASPLPVIAFGVINLLIVLVFILLTRYLTSRYAMIFSLALALAVPFIAREMLARAAPGTRLASWLLVLFFVFSAVDSYYSFGRSKSYVADAIAWMDGNSGETARLLTNNRAVAYYSGMVAEFDQVQSRLTEDQIRATESGDVIVVEISAANEQLLARPGIANLLEPVAAFPAGEPRMAIYRRVTP